MKIIKKIIICLLFLLITIIAAFATVNTVSLKPVCFTLFYIGFGCFMYMLFDIIGIKHYKKLR